MRSTPSNRVLTLSLWGLLSGSAAGLALRHDVEESRYLELGQRFPAVVQVGGLASGTLIAPTWVLTAAHAPELLQRMSPDKPLEVRLGERTFEVARVVYPEARKQSREEHDIALLKLATSVPEEIAPLELLAQAPEPGTEFVLAGWGILSIADQGVRLSPEAMQSPTRRLRAGWNAVEWLDEEKRQLVALLDGPDTALELEAGPCLGDSGGPALVRVPGAGEEPQTWRVAGVIAAIDDGDADGVLGEYGEEFRMTLVPAYADWIRATLQE